LLDAERAVGPDADGFTALARQVAVLLHKDLAAAQDLAATAGVELPLVDVAQAHGDDTLGLSTTRV
jgi:3-hydroxyisobutyrate dehydrogenase-like beta-hydroxyacid dehydrogenase